MILSIEVSVGSEKELERIRAIMQMFPTVNVIAHATYDSRSRKKAFAFMNRWASTKTPFIMTYRDTESEQGLQGFYSEASKDVINDLKYFIKEQNLLL